MMKQWMKIKQAPRRGWLWGLLVAYIVMLTINGIAGSTTLLGGLQTGEVSDAYANLFAPAGVTFSIWGVIYILLAGFLLRAFGVIRTKKPQVKPAVMNQVLLYFFATCVLNILWLVAWQYQVLWLSVIIMLGLLATLLSAVTALHPAKMSRGEYWLVRVPFSVYLGWIAVATIANVTTWLVGIGWSGFGFAETTWTILILAVGTVIALLHGYAKRDPFFVAVFVWAFGGILYKHLSASGFDGMYMNVVIALAILLPVLITTTAQLFREETRLR